MLSCFQPLNQGCEAWPLLGIKPPALLHDLADFRVAHWRGFHMITILYLCTHTYVIIDHD